MGGWHATIMVGNSCGILWVSLWAAAPAPPAVSFEAAVRAAASHPEVAASEARAETRRTRRSRLSGLAQPAELWGTGGYRLGAPRSNDGFDGSFGIEQVLHLGNRAGRQRDAADGRTRADAAEARFRRRNAELRAADAWLAAWVAHRRWERLSEVLKDARRIRQQVVRRLELGDATDLDQAQAERFVAAARLEVLAAEGDAFDAGVRLAAAMARAPGPIVPTEDLPSFGTLPSVSRSAQLDPEVQATERAAVAATLETRAARAASSTQLRIGASLGTEPPGDLIPAATVGITLPTGRSNAPAEVTAAARAAASRTHATAAMRAAQRLEALVNHEVEHRRAVLDVYDRELLPAVRRELSAVERSWQLGEVSLRPVLQARVDLLEAEIDGERARAGLVGACFAAETVEDSRVEKGGVP